MQVLSRWRRSEVKMRLWLWSTTPTSLIELCLHKQNLSMRLSRMQLQVKRVRNRSHFQNRHRNLSWKMSRSISLKNPNNDQSKSKPIKANESTKTTSITSPYSKTKYPSFNLQSTDTRSNSKKKKLSKKNSKTWSTSFLLKLIIRLWKYQSLSRRMCECRIWNRSLSRLKHRHRRFTIKRRMSWENKLGIFSMSACFWRRRILKKMKKFSSFKESCIPIKDNFCFQMKK